MSTLPEIPGHRVMVTPGGPFGRAYFDCTCGESVVAASPLAANQSAARHYLDVGGRIPEAILARLWPKVGAA